MVLIRDKISREFSASTHPSSETDSNPIIPDRNSRFLIRVLPIRITRRRCDCENKLSTQSSMLVPVRSQLSRYRKSQRRSVLSVTSVNRKSTIRGCQQNCDVFCKHAFILSGGCLLEVVNRMAVTVSVGKKNLLSVVNCVFTVMPYGGAFGRLICRSIGVPSDSSRHEIHLLFE